MLTYDSWKNLAQKAIDEVSKRSNTQVALIRVFKAVSPKKPVSRAVNR
jgi:hypothetical protein